MTQITEWPIDHLRKLFKNFIFGKFKQFLPHNTHNTHFHSHPLHSESEKIIVNQTHFFYLFDLYFHCIVNYKLYRTLSHAHSYTQHYIFICQFANEMVFNLQSQSQFSICYNNHNINLLKFWHTTQLSYSKPYRKIEPHKITENCKQKHRNTKRWTSTNAPVGHVKSHTHTHTHTQTQTYTHSHTNTIHPMRDRNS